MQVGDSIGIILKCLRDGKAYWKLAEGKRKTEVTEMTDSEKREKVIRGLELCAYDPDPGQELKEIRSCPECPYYRAGCSPQLIRDALALLKEQEARIEELEGARTIAENTWADGLYDAYKIIEEEVDAADVEPVRHGRWEVADYAEPDHHGVCVAHYPGGGLYCTECLHGWKRERVEGFECCPHCGAKMDKEADNGDK